MATFNQCQFIGNVGKDPELTVTPNTGAQVTRFSLAVNQGKDTPPLWLNIVCWDKLADLADRLLHKGATVFVQGRLQLRSYKDKKEVDRISIEIVATAIQLLDKRQETPGEDEMPTTDQA